MFTHFWALYAFLGSGGADKRRKGLIYNNLLFSHKTRQHIKKDASARQTDYPQSKSGSIAYLWPIAKTMDTKHQQSWIIHQQQKKTVAQLHQILARFAHTLRDSWRLIERIIIECPFDWKVIVHSTPPQHKLCFTFFRGHCGTRNMCLIKLCEIEGFIYDPNFGGRKEDGCILNWKRFERRI